MRNKHLLGDGDGDGDGAGDGDGDGAGVEEKEEVRLIRREAGGHQSSRMNGRLTNE